MTPTAALGAMPASAPASAPATIRWWKMSPAATSTDWLEPPPGLVLIEANLPINAVVVAVTTLTVPPTPTAAPPEKTALMPMPIRSSLLVAVTARPWKPGLLFWLMVWVPVTSAASPDGEAPDFTRLWPRHSAGQLGPVVAAVAFRVIA